MLIRRSELRLALTAGLMNGLGALAPIPYGFYAPMAVLVVCTGSFGGSIGLGRQRLLGSVAGAVVLLVFSSGLGHLPIPFGLALALLAMRLLGAALGLEVGYKVGSNIIVMGWLVHDAELDLWLPVRLFWTVAGILVALLSLRLFWPEMAVESGRRRMRRFLADLTAALSAQADGLETAASAASGQLVREQRRERQTTQELRRQLVELRAALPAVAEELGSNPSRHSTFRLFQLLTGAGSQLVGVFDGLRLLEHTPADRGPLEGIHRAQAELLRTVAGRLDLWGACFEAPHQHRQPPPAQALAPPPLWDRLESWLHDPDLDGCGLAQLQRNASRLMLCARALRSVEQTERRWQALAAGRA